MVVSMTAFTLNDACMKALGAEWPLFQSIFLRGCGTIFIMAAIAAAMGHLRFSHSRQDWTLMGIRTLTEVGAAYFFISAIFNMPLADATAIIQTLPLTVTLAAALAFGEPVGWRRLSAIAIGFVGVLLIVRPGFEGFTIYSVYALIAVVLVTIRDLAARRMSPDIPSLFAATVSATGVCLFAGLGSLTETWAPITPRAGLLLVGAMATIGVAYVASVATMRQGEIGFVAPYRYSAIIVALILGITLFQEIPDALTMVGAGLVVTTGLFTLYRERVVRRG